MGKRVSQGVEKLDRQKYRLWWTDPRTHKECSSIFYGTGAAAIAARAAEGPMKRCAVCDQTYPAEYDRCPVCAKTAA